MFSGPFLLGVLCELWRDVVPQGYPTVLTTLRTRPCGHHQPTKPTPPEPSGRALYGEAGQPDTQTNCSPPAPSSPDWDSRNEMSVICSGQNMTLVVNAAKEVTSKLGPNGADLLDGRPSIFMLRAGAGAEEMYMTETILKKLEVMYNAIISQSVSLVPPRTAHFCSSPEPVHLIQLMLVGWFRVWAQMCSPGGTRGMDRGTLYQKFWEWHAYSFSQSLLPHFVSWQFAYIPECYEEWRWIAINCKVPLCHANELNPPKTLPLHFSPATKGPANMSGILSLTQVWVLTRIRLEITLVMLIEFE